MPKTKHPKNEGAPSRYQKAQDVGGRLEILRAVHEAGGDKTRAAELLGISRRHLYREIERMGMKEEVDRIGGAVT